jgi:hypothetical protein
MRDKKCFKKERKKKKMTLLRFEPTAFSFNVGTVVLAYLNTLQSRGNALG